MDFDWLYYQKLLLTIIGTCVIGIAGFIVCDFLFEVLS